MRTAQIISLSLAALLALCVSVQADGLSPSSDENAIVSGQESRDVSEQKAVESVSAPRHDSLERADEETQAAAIGHYARSRSLLLAALREFDYGYKIAKPDAILNSKAWRESVISRAEELEKILAPQPRITKSGVRFSPDNRLLKSEAKGK